MTDREGWLLVALMLGAIVAFIYFASSHQMELIARCERLGGVWMGECVRREAVIPMSR